MEERIRDWEKGVSNPIPSQKYEKFKEKLAEYSDRNKERNIMLFILGRTTGYRLGDIVGLTIGQIKDALDNERFIIQESKQYEQWKTNLKNKPNKKKPLVRESPIGKNLERYLRQYCKDKKRSEYAFKSNKGNGNEYISQKAFSALLTEVGKSMGLKNISGHSLRKTYATKIYEESNNNLEQVRVALNHQSIEETKRYLGIKEKMKMNAALIADADI
ncbi:tyrosine-type recombinase/integrase [Clostridium tagluense]|uniref:Integrase n=1 Tax=Clostridium tagluense TaxID=360422 RepID=A0A401UUT8_9CLOT|nr:tyrosine-type recombinase/integrase [Clostridium tagluense]GCD13301.1 integrase [Clostridium tagluense]